jgi:hypothetical protein
MEVDGQLHVLETVTMGKGHRLCIGYEVGWTPELI